MQLYVETKWTLKNSNFSRVLTAAGLEKVEELD